MGARIRPGQEVPGEGWRAPGSTSLRPPLPPSPPDQPPIFKPKARHGKAWERKKEARSRDSPQPAPAGGGHRPFSPVPCRKSLVGPPARIPNQPHTCHSPGELRVTQFGGQGGLRRTAESSCEREALGGGSGASPRARAGPSPPAQPAVAPRKKTPTTPPHSAAAWWCNPGCTSTAKQREALRRRQARLRAHKRRGGAARRTRRRRRPARGARNAPAPARRPRAWPAPRAGPRGLADSRDR